MSMQRTASIAALMGLVAASLAVMSGLHLSGTLGGSPPFNGSHAGVAEAIICVVLLAGAAALLRRTARAGALAIAATGFAVIGFLVGLSFTIRGADTTGIAYHVVVLPLLLLTLAALLQARQATPPARRGGQRSRPRPSSP